MKDGSGIRLLSFVNLAWTVLTIRQCIFVEALKDTSRSYFFIDVGLIWEEG